jgi:glucose-1-phosphate cytidylyltransferase
MKAVILAGGLGTRISEETYIKPKPMVEIGHMPILWHIMKIYSTHGINDFIVCCGYKSFMIKQYFANYFLYTSDVTFDIQNNKMEIHEKHSEPWKVTLVDTGETTGTGGRLKRVKNFLDNEPFCFTYGDGVSDVNIKELIDFHKKHKKLATVTAVQPPGRYGYMDIENEKVTSFIEKPDGEGGWINGGFFILEPKTIDYIADDNTNWEREPLEKLAKESQLSVYKHSGFWQAMDTLREKNLLNSLWESNKAPWKVW